MSIKLHTLFYILQVIIVEYKLKGNAYLIFSVFFLENLFFETNVKIYLQLPEQIVLKEIKMLKNPLTKTFSGDE